jgi:hypothetical protein
MSYSFEARFSPSKLSFEEILVRLERALEESRVLFEQRVYRLHSDGGVPTVNSIEPVEAETLKDVGSLARRWWGVSLHCVSEPLYEVLGRSEAMEVFLRVFKRHDEHLVSYVESSSAFKARQENQDLTRDLIALLAGICSAVEADISIYDEELDDELRVPTLDEVNTRLTALASSSAPPMWCMVVNGKCMDYPTARLRAGRLSQEVKLASSGYVVFPFLK